MDRMWRSAHRHLKRNSRGKRKQWKGIPYGRGDVSYLLPVFRDLNAVVSFWESDEEFAPKLNFLCDGNTLNFMHYETMMYLLCHIAERLEEVFRGEEKEPQ